ncbi:acyl-CoA thioesterase [Rhodobacteraceae bacterium 2CG4]|uniref:Acyl-CoA thioesterase n=1 Tax=Halovulum marinum TaxID=2662447 RepID=A0A6L5YVC8_9RHOB|nr:thioesterase family protein [Halovulum marinum]MSU88303.1 acyl-CoA thioesterase [Halovulum marinum]
MHSSTSTDAADTAETAATSVVRPQTRERRPRARRSDYAAFRPVTTRWRDNDVYGHLNNVVYYEFVDSCVNGWLIDAAGLELPAGPVIGLVVESACVYHDALAYPDQVETGLRVSRVGNSSVQYEVGMFRARDDSAAAEARFTHVYVDRDSRRPVPLPERLRAALGALRRG